MNNKWKRVRCRVYISVSYPWYLLGLDCHAGWMSTHKWSSTTTNAATLLLTILVVENYVLRK